MGDSSYLISGIGVLIGVILLGQLAVGLQREQHREQHPQYLYSLSRSVRMRCEWLLFLLQQPVNKASIVIMTELRCLLLVDFEALLSQNRDSATRPAARHDSLITSFWSRYDIGIRYYTYIYSLVIWIL